MDREVNDDTCSLTLPTHSGTKHFRLIGIYAALIQSVYVNVKPVKFYILEHIDAYHNSLYKC